MFAICDLKVCLAWMLYLSFEQTPTVLTKPNFTDVNYRETRLNETYLSDFLI